MGGEDGDLISHARRHEGNKGGGFLDLGPGSFSSFVFFFFFSFEFVYGETNENK